MVIVIVIATAVVKKVKIVLISVLVLQQQRIAVKITGRKELLKVTAYFYVVTVIHYSLLREKYG